MALSAAVLGLSVATAAAVADPTEGSTPPSSETSEPAAPPTETEPTQPTETVDPSTDPSTEPSTPPPSSSGEEQPPKEEPATQEPEKEADAPSVQSVRDLQMTATFDKASYNTGEKMTISYTLKNAGTEALTVQADFYSGEPDRVSVDDPYASPVTLAPGASTSGTITGAVGNPDVTTGKLYASWYPAGGGEAKIFEFTVPIKQTTGHVSGTVYTDRNNNGKFDAGEGQNGVTLTFYSQIYYGFNPTASTNAAGEFSLDLPTGRYYLSGTAPDGLLVSSRPLTVDQSGVDDVLLRSVSPISGLSVALEFTKDTYAPDEAPVVRVTLTNDGDQALHGIVANCNRGGFDTELTGNGEGWGGLAHQSDGVTLAPHSTTVLDVTEPMPNAAADHGYVVVACDFDYQGVDDINAPSDFDIANVPGQHGDLTGNVIDRDGNGIAGARLVLASQDDDCSVAEVVSDENGEFAFRQVPVGIYDLYVVPPSGWQFAPDNPTSTYVMGSYTGSMYVVLEPGDAPAPAVPAKCPTGSGPTQPAAPPAPAPQARPAPAGLAETGASVIVPGILGLLAVLAGGGVVLVTRRRKPIED